MSAGWLRQMGRFAWNEHPEHRAELLTAAGFGPECEEHAALVGCSTAVELFDALYAPSQGRYREDALAILESIGEAALARGWNR